MSREVSLQELMVASFQYQMDELYTSIPCVVVGVHLESQTVDIQPSINQKMVDGTVLERPVIMGVPVEFPISDTAGITFPINVGTTGLATFAMRDMTAWKAGNGRPSSPLNNAKMDKNDAIFTPGIQPPGISVNNPAKRVLPHSVLDTVVVNNIGTADEVEVRLKSSGDIEVNAPTKAVTINCKTSYVNASESAGIASPTVTLDATNLSITGDITHSGGWNGTGNYVFNGITFNSHKHPETGSITGAPTN